MEKDNIKIEEIKAYEVGCCGKIFKSLKGAKLHIANTAHNPATHSCQTCRYYIDFWNNGTQNFPNDCEYGGNIFYPIPPEYYSRKGIAMRCKCWDLGKRDK